MINGNNLPLPTELSIAAPDFVPRTSRDDTQRRNSSLLRRSSGVGTSGGSSMVSRRACEFVPAAAASRSNMVENGSNAPDSSSLSIVAAEFIPNSATGAGRATPLCRFYLKGACRKGLDCPFVHDSAAAISNMACTGAGSSAGLDDTSETPRTMSITLEEGVECEFGPGASVEKLRLHATSAGASSGSENKHGLGAYAGTSIKVQWYAPSRCAWATFAFSDQATRAAKALEGKSYGRRLLSAKTTFSRIKQPIFDIRHTRYPISQCSTWSIAIGNLDGEVSPFGLQRFIERHAKCKVRSLTLGNLPFTEEQGPGIVRKLLERFGKVTSFDPAPVDVDRDGQKRKALVKFENDKDADRACRKISKTDRIKELGGSKVFATQIYTAKYTLSKDTMDVIYKEVAEKLAAYPSARYSIFENVASKSLLVRTDDRNVSESIRDQLNPIITGEVLRGTQTGSQAIWNRYVSSPSFLLNLRQLPDCAYRHVWRDKSRQQVRIFGSAAKRKQVAKALLRHCSQMMVEVHAVPIPLAEFDSILLKGGDALKKIIQVVSCKVSLDLKSRSLLVEGSSGDAMRVKAYIIKLANGASSSIDGLNQGTLCPVCFCPPGEDDDPSSIVSLSCKHAYCKECYQGWLTGANNCKFPLECLDENCTEKVLLSDLKTSLPTDTFLAVLRTSMDNFVRGNNTKYRFCLAPTCPGIYEVTEGEKQAACCACALKICMECNASHEGVTCKDFRLASLPPNRMREKIIDDILTLRCPRCRQAFYDFEGCFALYCSVCPCRFCGWCLSDCGNQDAHPHVATCPHKEPGADKYFGTKEMFESAQNKRRRKALLELLDSQQPNERQASIEAVKQDLKDLGIVLPRR